MEWLQAFVIAGSTVGACWMMHRENKELAEKMATLAGKMADESKEFHGRLCALEERYLQMMHKYLDDKK
jgi:hypothetical protein